MTRGPSARNAVAVLARSCGRMHLGRGGVTFLLGGQKATTTCVASSQRNLLSVLKQTDEFTDAE